MDTLQHTDLNTFTFQGEEVLHWVTENKTGELLLHVLPDGLHIACRTRQGTHGVVRDVALCRNAEEVIAALGDDAQAREFAREAGLLPEVMESQD